MLQLRHDSLNCVVSQPPDNPPAQVISNVVYRHAILLPPAHRVLLAEYHYCVPCSFCFIYIYSIVHLPCHQARQQREQPTFSSCVAPVVDKSETADLMFTRYTPWVTLHTSPSVSPLFSAASFYAHRFQSQPISHPRKWGP